MFPVTLAVKMKGFALVAGRELRRRIGPGVHLAVFEMWVSAVEGAHATTVPFRERPLRIWDTAAVRRPHLENREMWGTRCFCVRLPGRGVWAR
jgi:hypothetical protein